MTQLIDTHQHLIYRDVAGYGWTDDIPALAGQEFMLATYQDLTKGADVIGSLFMETGVDDADYRAEARFAAGLARTPENGVLGIIPSCRPEQDAGFSDWLEEAISLGAKGFRRILHVMPDDLSTTDTFRRNIRAIGARGLPFDLCILPSQMPQGAALASACPDTVMILDHCGVPDIAQGNPAQWQSGLQTLAALPNVYCKLSGLLAYCAPGDASLETIAPYVAHALDLFGPDRMLWGSDWPVVDMANGLPQWLNITQAILSDLSPDEAAAIGTKTAQKVYRLV